MELFGGEILKSLSNSDDDNVSDKSSVRYVSQQQLIALSTGIPACLLSIVYLKCRNIKELQVFGFILIAFFFLLLACLYAPLKHSNVDALFAVYCLLLFSLSFGPNLTTFILPAQIYPKEVRTTLNGISAACGKLGAFTGVYVFGPVAEATSYSTGKTSITYVIIVSFDNYNHIRLLVLLHIIDKYSYGVLCSN